MQPFPRSGSFESRPRLGRTTVILAELFLMLAVSVPAAERGTVLLPAGDTYVRSLSRDSRKNFGAESMIDIRSSVREGISEGYIAFDPSQFTGSMTNARLRFHANLERPGTAVVLVRSATSTNWSEKFLTWWERIPHAVTLGRVDVTAGSPAWYEVDVTPFVHQQLAARGRWINFALVYGSDSANRVQVRSRENKGFEPQLVLTRGQFQARVQFLPNGSALEPGYLADNGNPFGLREGGLSYGWNQDMTKHTRDRISTNNTAAQRKLASQRKAPSRLHETFTFVDHKDIKTKAVWEIDVPNGRFNVRVIAGDLLAKDSVYAISVEDKKIFDVIPEDTHRWADAAITVEVTDGRLSVTDHPNGSQNKICAIEITEAP